MAIRAYYHASVSEFLAEDQERILGLMTQEHHHSLDEQQRWAWMQQILILKSAFAKSESGHIFLELYIPRMGKRADAIVIYRNIVFVIEFKVGAADYSSNAFDQVVDYALDLKNFHGGSHAVAVVPLLVSTHAEAHVPEISFREDLVAAPIGTNAASLGSTLELIANSRGFPTLLVDEWMAAGYRPTPTIIEAAQVLYETHSVVEIARHDAGAQNLAETTSSIVQIIDDARQNHRKAICFVTGVPGSGKTLAGLNLATRRLDEHREENAVFLSGNGPLVAVLREALARDKARRDSISKKAAEREVRSFIQNIHHFRDEYLGNLEVPLERVVVFDEAQRAWTRAQAASFMQRKRGRDNFNMSEPEFLISVLDRHNDWCTVVCLIGEGQEINTGEAGVSEWLKTLSAHFTEWSVYASPRVAEFADGGGEIQNLVMSDRFHGDEHLHLSVSMRSYRAEALSDCIGHIIDGDSDAARRSFEQFQDDYPIFLTRSLDAARNWLRQQSRGTERYGLVASSGAGRLRPEGIFVKAKIDPPTWFLNDREDVRSSFYLEEVASEFDVQGLELDWVGVAWDGDFRHDGSDWSYHAFEGTRWKTVKDTSKRTFLKNAYRVLLTRARQGMIIFVPTGEAIDYTRPKSFYDGTFEFLHMCGIPDLP